MKMIPMKTSILELCVMQRFICIIRQNSFQKNSGNITICVHVFVCI